MAETDGKSSAENFYRKGNFKLVDHGRGRVTLQATDMNDDDGSQFVSHGNVSLDTSGLSLAGDQVPENNPYDSAPLDRAAAIWSKGTIR